MRIHVLSDLHLEFWRDPRAYPLSDVGAEVLVLAGDIHSHTKGLVWAAEARNRLGIPVIYVPGNHEFYNSHLQGMAVEMRKVAQELGVHLLDSNQLILDGVRFLGTTLWTDFCLWGKGAKLGDALNLAKHYMNDFNCIRFGSTGWLLPAQSVILHQAAVEWLTKCLAEPFEGPTVIVTHHCPHPDSVAECYKKDGLTPAFCSDLSGLIGQYTPDVWIHGHTHHAFDYYAGKTRIVCNPSGYPNERFAGFDPGKVVEV